MRVNTYGSLARHDRIIKTLERAALLFTALAVILAGCVEQERKWKLTPAKVGYTLESTYKTLGDCLEHGLVIGGSFACDEE